MHGPMCPSRPLHATHGTVGTRSDVSTRPDRRFKSGRPDFVGIWPLERLLPGGGGPDVGVAERGRTVGEWPGRRDDRLASGEGLRAPLLNGGAYRGVSGV